MEQSTKFEHLKATINALNDVSGNLSGAYKGLISEGMSPRHAKTICMIYVKYAFKEISVR